MTDAGFARRGRALLCSGCDCRGSGVPVVWRRVVRCPPGRRL